MRLRDPRPSVAVELPAGAGCAAVTARGGGGDPDAGTEEAGGRPARNPWSTIGRGGPFRGYPPGEGMSDILLTASSISCGVISTVREDRTQPRVLAASDAAITEAASGMS